jgi:transmembrane sensor
MEAVNYQGADLLIKYLLGDITSEELQLLYSYMESSPVLKEKFEELSNPENRAQRLRDYIDININTEAAWDKFINIYPFTGSNPAFTKKSFKYRFKIWHALVAIFFITSTIIFFHFISSKIKPETKPVTVSANNLFASDTITTQFASYNYLDLPDGRKLNLEVMPFDTLIEWEGAKIVYKGTWLDFQYNDGEEKKTNAINKLATASGKQMNLRLPDGSRVTLNANSSITFPFRFDKNQRTVDVSGEAYFDVESDPGVPFVVQLKNKVLVKAYGTSFTVTNYKKEQCYATLFKGKVTISKDGQNKALREGEQIQITDGQQQFKIVRANLDQAIAWTKNKFDFNDLEFRQMMLEIGGWYGYNVVFDGEMPQKTSSGKLDRNVNLVYLIKVIEKQNQVKIDIKEDAKRLVVIGKNSGYKNGAFYFSGCTLP